jgi:hypothetical protein
VNLRNTKSSRKQRESFAMSLTSARNIARAAAHTVCIDRAHATCVYFESRQINLHLRARIMGMCSYVRKKERGLYHVAAVSPSLYIEYRDLNDSSSNNLKLE